jgi:hypothetical protein
MKNVDQMTEDEVREELEKLLARKKKYVGTNRRKELIEKDPTAYFTRPNDFARAERTAEGSTANIPKWNHTGTVKDRPLTTYNVVVVNILDKNRSILEKENVPIDGEVTYAKLHLDETQIPVESIIYVMDASYRLWTFEP